MVSWRRSLLATFCWAIVAGPACDGSPENSPTSADGGEASGGARDATADVTATDVMGEEAIADVVAEPRASDAEAIDVKIEAPMVEAQPPDDPTCLWPIPVAGACGLFMVEPPLMPRVDCVRPKRMLIAGMPSPRDLTVDAQGLYWVSDDVLYRLRDGEMKADQLALVTGQHMFAFDDDYVYFGRDTAPQRCAIMRVKRDGADLAAVVEDLRCDDGAGKPAFVPDGDRLYYSDQIDQGAFPTIVSVLKVGGDKIATEFSGLFKFDGDYMYWLGTTVGTARHLYRARKGTTSWSQPRDHLGSWTFGSQRWQLDGDRVLVARSYYGSISAVPTTPADGGLARCAEILVWEEQPQPREASRKFAADERSIYWVDPSGTEVWKAPRAGGMAARVLGGPDTAVTDYGDMALSPTKVFIANLTDGAIDVFDR